MLTPSVDPASAQPLILVLVTNKVLAEEAFNDEGELVDVDKLKEARGIQAGVFVRSLYLWGVRPAGAWLTLPTDRHHLSALVSMVVFEAQRRQSHRRCIEEIQRDRPSQR